MDTVSPPLGGGGGGGPTSASRHIWVLAVVLLKPDGSGWHCRDHRPAKIAIILRGIPGSGKTHIAKKLREVELENGGEAPRIHALDDYFVTVPPPPPSFTNPLLNLLMSRSIPLKLNLLA